MNAALASFVRLKIDASDRQDRKAAVQLQQNGVGALPTLIFLNKDGEETARLQGPQSAEAIIEAARKAKE